MKESLFFIVVQFIANKIGTEKHGRYIFLANDSYDEPVRKRSISLFYPPNMQNMGLMFC